MKKTSTLWLAAMLFCMVAGPALAEQRTIYGKDGVAIGRIDTDSQGTTTLYGRDGRVITRESTTRSGTIIYDGLSGDIIGKTDKPREKRRDR